MHMLSVIGKTQKFISFSFSLFIFFSLASLYPALAQQCDLFGLVPSTVAPGENSEITFSGQLTDRDAVLVDINGTRYFTLDCNESSCSNRSNITSIDTSGFSANSSVQVRITHIVPGIGQCNSTRTLSILASEEAESFCSPVGLTSVSPSEGDEGSIFRFQGCLGPYVTGSNPGVVFSNRGQNSQTERQLSTSEVDAEGIFSVTRSQFSVGVWSARLFVNQSAQGQSLEFSVDAADSICSVSVQCIVDGRQGAKVCTGTRRGTEQCQYNEDFCEECTYATEDPAENEERSISDFDFCQQVPAGSQRSNCEACYQEASEAEGRVYTAVGCIRTGGQGLTQDVIRVLMGISGGIALLSILAGAFLYTVSQGDASKVKEAKGLITAAVTGLFFIIFSIFILQFVGVSIFRIPGLG